MVIDEINQNRLRTWSNYYVGLKELEEKGLIEMPTIPKDCIHNAHMFYLKVKDLKVRTSLIKHLKLHEILSVFHYIPLHSSKAGLNFGEFNGTDQFTTRESERLMRLPIFYKIKKKEIDYIINQIILFLSKR